VIVFDLHGRVALVTGAGQGVGLGIAASLGAQGAHVAVNDLKEDRAHTAAAHIADTTGTKTMAIPFDVTDYAAVVDGFAQVARDFGAVDIVVNNAGIPADGFPQVDFKDADPELWRRFVDLNLYGVLNCTHTVLAGMCERGWGRVITISSEAGRVGLPIRVALYGAAKAGAIGLTKHVAHEVGRFGVTCNALTLGTMEGAPLDPSRFPIPRLGRGRDVGAMVAFLASDDAEWITGQAIGVNGGAVT
jgi:NAD(P)-dependent dehydrogenase (short-subunit alcohol dehydrogenase family)